LVKVINENEAPGEYEGKGLGLLAERSPTLQVPPHCVQTSVGKRTKKQTTPQQGPDHKKKKVSVKDRGGGQISGSCSGPGFRPEVISLKE